MLLNPEATAERLTVTKGTLAKWRVFGQGPHYLKIGSKVLYDAADVEDWIASRRVQSTSERAA